VALAAGYSQWLALTAGGRVFSCSTGDDGYGRGLALAPGAGAPNAAAPARARSKDAGGAPGRHVGRGSAGALAPGALRPRRSPSLGRRRPRRHPGCHLASMAGSTAVQERRAPSGCRSPLPNCPASALSVEPSGMRQRVAARVRTPPPPVCRHASRRVARAQAACGACRGRCASRPGAAGARRSARTAAYGPGAAGPRRGCGWGRGGGAARAPPARAPAGVWSAAALGPRAERGCRRALHRRGHRGGAGGRPGLSCMGAALLAAAPLLRADMVRCTAALQQVLQQVRSSVGKHA
jgi:hypothetical protein